jgi:hypothetical protein
MINDELAGFILTPETGGEYFRRVMEAEKKMGPLSQDERLTILKSLGKSITLGELLDMMAGKRVLIVKDQDEKD